VHISYSENTIFLDVVLSPVECFRHLHGGPALAVPQGGLLGATAVGTTPGHLLTHSVTCGLLIEWDVESEIWD
jgi:hypothetical protein